ncbi:hypothetical protein TNCT_417361 [Trichonephila clavata]|uniref:Uncharacterized protein n=1 Tax=Trichonephila clavata TaxID=2740835 RepID=A0A8X6FW49_TRICU|nr:hypothetical protein TNCT_417361 [Trichonephila clavata]
MERMQIRKDERIVREPILFIIKNGYFGGTVGNDLDRKGVWMESRTPGGGEGIDIVCQRLSGSHDADRAPSGRSREHSPGNDPKTGERSGSCFSWGPRCMGSGNYFLLRDLLIL